MTPDVSPHLHPLYESSGTLPERIQFIQHLSSCIAPNFDCYMIYKKA